jgi:4-hydroxy-tetrahydrodipicolinate reductase
MTISVLVNGAAGRMGQAAVQAINAHDKLQLAGLANSGDVLSDVIKTQQPDVVLDFTSAASVLANAKMIIDCGVHPVIGTSGLLPDDVRALQQLCAAKKLGGIIAPNFCIGAVLMMRFAKEAAKYYPHAEIIELHHDKKKDAPSGTAIKTAEIIANVRPNDYQRGTETIAGARGADLQNVPIHSVRLPGLLAHQEVLFGSAGELLTIRHDSFSREAYMPGVCFACEQVVGLTELVYGLEHLL